MTIISTEQGKSVTVTLTSDEIKAIIDSVCREVLTAEAISIVNELGVALARFEKARRTFAWADWNTFVDRREQCRSNQQSL